MSIATLLDRLPVLRERAARGEAWESTTDEDVALLLAEIDRLEAALRECADAFDSKGLSVAARKIDAFLAGGLS